MIIINLEEFKQYLADALYKYAGVLHDSQTTNAIHFYRMFEKAPKEEAIILLNSAEFHQEFHPDTIEFIRKKLATRNN